MGKREIGGLTNLANARLALSFEPATEADRATIESYLPETDENGEIDPNDLPARLPDHPTGFDAAIRQVSQSRSNELHPVFLHEIGDRP